MKTKTIKRLMLNKLSIARLNDTNVLNVRIGEAIRSLRGYTCYVANSAKTNPVKPDDIHSFDFFCNTLEQTLNNASEDFGCFATRFICV